MDARERKKIDEGMEERYEGMKEREGIEGVRRRDIKGWKEGEK